MPRQITVADLSRMKAAGQAVRLLDVRQAWEHDIAALPDSQLIPLGELAGRVAEIEHESGCLLVVYCHHGIRSLSAAAYLEHIGLESVASLAGGIDAWSRDIDSKVPRY